jgi:NADH:ubiquinone oxidoreductase subunit 2 (subunit N)
MSQLGLSLMTLGLFFENSVLSVLFSVFNFLIYIFTSLIFFLILFRGLTLNKKPLNNFENIQFPINGLDQFNSHFSFLLTLNILSMAGIPPLLGFFSKYLILSLFCIYSPFLVLLLLLLHIVNTFNYLRLVQII